MTILYSLYASEGIIFAADRMITKSSSSGRVYVDSRLPKVLPVPKLGVHDRGGVIGYFGLAEIGNKPTTTWLRQMIQLHANSGGSVRVRPFVAKLLDTLPDAIRPEYRGEVLGIHIGAFEHYGRHRLPVFWFVRNCELTADGGYVVRGGWKAEEQLLGRDLKTVSSSEVRPELRRIQKTSSVPFWYRNGDLRSFAPVTEAIKAAVAYTASLPGYAPPDGYDAWCDLGRTFVFTSRSLVRLTYRGGHVTIGGKTDIEGLRWS